MSLDQPLFLDSGDTALVVEFSRDVDPQVNDKVIALAEALDARALPGLVECVPTYRSLMVHFDPLVLTREALTAEVTASLAGHAAPTRERHLWRMPCSYEAPHAEDIAELAGLCGLTVDQVINLHKSAQYRAYMYGFVPGYCYLGGLPPELLVPRRRTVRPPHPVNAMLTAAGLAGIATFSMPTGWYVIGKVAQSLYLKGREPAFLLQPGDEVLFEPVDNATFDALFARDQQGEIFIRPEKLPS